MLTKHQNKKKILILLALFISLNALSQKNRTNILDSIKAKISNDTLRFKKADIFENSIGIFNQNEYSPLFIINEKYIYKLDIIEPKKVKEFINQYLVSDRIKKIMIIKPNEAQALYGSHGKQGAIFIELNTENFNPEIANLKIRKNTIPNNFSSNKTQGMFGS